MTRIFRPRFVVSLLVGLAAFGSCGKDEQVAQEETVHHVQTSTTLEEKGTAESPEEVARREAEATARREAQVAAKKAFEWQQKLETAAKKKDAFDIAEALEGIAQLGGAAAPIDAKLDAYATNEDKDVRMAALRCLVAVRGARARAALQTAMKDEEDAVRVVAVRLWQKAGIDDVAAVVPLLDDFNADVQYETVAVIKAKTPNAKDLALLREKASFLEGPAARLALSYAVEGFDSLGGAPAIEGLVAELMDHQDEQTRLAAVDAAAQKDVQRKVVALKLAGLLRTDPDEDVRRRAGDLLFRWGGAGAPAYDPTAEEPARKEAAAAWAAWIESNGERFK